MRAPSLKVFVSLLITATVLGQVAVSAFSLPLVRHWDEGTRPTGITRFVRPPTLWPFVNYPMYSQARFPGDTIFEFALVGEFEDGSRGEIPPERLGLGSYHYQILLRRLRSGDLSAVRYVRERYEATPRGLPSLLFVRRDAMVLREAGVDPRPASFLHPAIPLP